MEERIPQRRRPAHVMSARIVRLLSVLSLVVWSPAPDPAAPIAARTRHQAVRSEGFPRSPRGGPPDLASLPRQALLAVTCQAVARNVI